MAIKATSGYLGQGMTLSTVGAPRYLAALLWHWTLPFMFGAVAASIVALYGIQSSIELVDQSFDRTMQQMIDSCTTEATETAEISGATRSLFPLARGPTSPPGALATHPPTTPF